MDTLSFFNLILPESGIKVLAEPGDKPGVFRHFKFDTIAKAAAAAVQFNKRGMHIYHALSGFKEDRPKGMRKQDNAGWQKAFWIDLDVRKPDEETDEKYATKRDALAALLAFCKAQNFPQPLIVDSGRGVHAYWPLDNEVTSEEWKPVAEQFKTMLHEHGIKQDRTRTADHASILRPVGMLNRKYDPPREVKLLRAVEPISIDTFKNAVGYVARPAVLSRFQLSSALSSPNEYPPSSALKIIEHCATLKHIAETGGDVPEPLWHKMVGVIKHTTEADLQVHKWSVGHPNYSEYETQVKIDNWVHGPSTCDIIRSTDGNKCEGCKLQCKSPIQLGYTEQQADSAEPPQPPPPVVLPPMTTAQRLKLARPSGYDISGNTLSKFIKDADGVLVPIKFCNNYFYPFDRIRNEEGTWEVHVAMHERNGKVRKFVVPAEALADSRKLVVELGAYELYVFGKSGKEYAMSWMQEYVGNLQQIDAHTITHKQFGWNDAGDGFVVGNKLLTCVGDKPARMSRDAISGGMGGDFGIAGTREEWIDTVNAIYNRPGAEAYQFAFLVSASAPLVKLANIANYHGIPVAYGGAGGQGKTTVCEMACGIWGKPAMFSHSAGKDGSTINGLLKHAAICNNLPRVFDELTDHAPKDVGGMLYAMSNGGGKIRLKANGEFAGDGLTWNTPNFVTGNIDFHELLYQLEQMKADAMSVRIFQIFVDETYAQRVFGGVNVKQLINEKLQYNYGVIGRELIKYYIEHRDQVRDAVTKLRAKFNAKSEDETKERFYIDTMVLAMVAGMVMKKLGHISFDLNAIQKWAIGNIKKLREGRRDNNLTESDHVANFIASLHGRTLVTKDIPNNRGIPKGKQVLEEIADPPREAPVARVATQLKRVYVSVQHFKDFCKHNNLQINALREALDKLGYMVKLTGRDDKEKGGFLFRLGQGTTVATGVSRCHELDYAKVYGMEADPAQSSADVVKLQAAMQQ